MARILALAFKDLQLLWADKFGLFWIFVFPLVYGLFFGAIFGGQREGSSTPMAIVLVDEDQSQAAKDLAKRLQASKALAVTSAPEAGQPDFDLAAARDLVRRGRRTAFVRIKKGYGEASGFGLFAPRSEPLVELGVDPSRQAEAGYLQGMLMEALFGGLAEAFTDGKAMRDAVAKSRQQIRQESDLPAAQRLVLDALFGALDRFATDADFGTLGGGPGGGGMSAASQLAIVDVTRDQAGRPRSPFEITFPSAILWGLMGCSTAFAITLVRERTQGTLLRLRVAPLSRAQLLAGKGLACFLTCLAVIAVMLVIGRLTLGVRIGSPPLLMLAVVCAATCFTGLMMSVSVLGKTEQGVAGAGWGLMMPLAMIGGGMVPLIAMPSWMLTVSHASPFKWSILAIEGAVWRDFTLAQMALPCGILVGTGAALFAIGVLVFRRMDR